MIAAKQPTFRFLFSGSRSITSAKTERTFGGLFLLGCLSQVMMMMLCEVEAPQSKLSLQKPITTQLSDLQKTAATRECRASFLFLTIIIMFTFHIRKLCIFYCIFYRKQHAFSRTVGNWQNWWQRYVHKTTESTLSHVLMTDIFI